MWSASELVALTATNPMQSTNSKMMEVAKLIRYAPTKNPGSRSKCSPHVGQRSRMWNQPR